MFFLDKIRNRAITCCVGTDIVSKKVDCGLLSLCPDKTVLHGKENLAHEMAP